MKNQETVIINGIEYVQKDQVNTTPKPEGDFVIVRCKNAGVHAGYLESRINGVLTLRDSRRLWRWWSKFTLSGLATCGVLAGKERECRFACVLPLIHLTEMDVCEVIPATTEARESIQLIVEHSNA
jgi:hypothetical protein